MKMRIKYFLLIGLLSMHTAVLAQVMGTTDDGKHLLKNYENDMQELLNGLVKAK